MLAAGLAIVTGLPDSTFVDIDHPVHGIFLFMASYHYDNTIKTDMQADNRNTFKQI
jgi:hypothetical protein